jgi:hypothetical protein
MFGLIIGGATFFILRSRIETAIYDGIEGYVTEKLTEIQENPKIVADLLKPAVMAMMKEFGASAGPEGLKDLKIGGFKIPAWVVQMVLPMITGPVKQSGQNAAAGALAALVEG